MSTGTKLSKTQLSKIFQSGGFLSAFLGRLAVTLMKVGVPLTEIFLSPLATMTSASAVGGAIQSNMRAKVVMRARKKNHYSNFK